MRVGEGRKEETYGFHGRGLRVLCVVGESRMEMLAVSMCELTILEVKHRHQTHRWITFTMPEREPKRSVELRTASRFERFTDECDGREVFTRLCVSADLLEHVKG